MDTPRVPLRQAYRDLGKLVRGAHYQGTTAIITEHGRPAAMITPVDADTAITSITATTVVDQRDGWHDQAIDAWIEAAADRGYGFVVIEYPESSEAIAVLERDRWHDDTGERYTLFAEWPEDLNPNLTDPYIAVIQAVRRETATEARRRRIADELATIEQQQGRDAPRAAELRRELHVLALEEHVQAVVDAAPPLTPDDAARLRALLPPMAPDTPESEGTSSTTPAEGPVTGSEFRYRK